MKIWFTNRSKKSTESISQYNFMGASTFGHFVSSNEFIVNYLSHFHGSLAAAASDLVCGLSYTHPRFRLWKGPIYAFSHVERAKWELSGRDTSAKQERLVGAALSMRRSKKRTIGSVTGRRNLKTAGLTCVRACLNKLDPRAVHRARLLFPRAFKLAFKTDFLLRKLARPDNYRLSDRGSFD